jgi:LysR family transcriptional regulator, glycine cleavage system transcriptional activator
MHADLPPLPWLRAFEAAARALSFTRAAEELHLTQAAISKQVKALEQHLGQPLFLRHPRSLELTRTGAAYLPKVHDALDRLSIGTREVFGRRRDDALTLRCAVSFATNWLAPRLPDYLARHPGKTLRLTASVWNDDADPDLYDLDIRYGTGNWPGYASHRLTWDHIFPLCAPNMRQGSPGLQTPQDLRHHRLLHVMGYQEGWGTWLAAAGAVSVDPGQGVQLDTSLIAFALAAQGGGVALARSSLAGPDLASGRLIAPFALQVPIVEAFYLAQPLHRPAHPDAADFADWLLSTRDAQA